MTISVGNASIIRELSSARVTAAVGGRGPALLTAADIDCVAAAGSKGGDQGDPPESRPPVKPK